MLLVRNVSTLAIGRRIDPSIVAGIANAGRDMASVGRDLAAVAGIRLPDGESPPAPSGSAALCPR